MVVKRIEITDDDKTLGQLKESCDPTVIIVVRHDPKGYRPHLLNFIKANYPNGTAISLINYNEFVNFDDDFTKENKHTESVSEYGVNEVINLEHLKELLRQKVENIEFRDIDANICLAIV